MRLWKPDTTECPNAFTFITVLLLCFPWWQLLVTLLFWNLFCLFTKKIYFIKFYIYLWQRQRTVPIHPFFLPFYYSHITSMLSKYMIAKNKPILLSLLWSEAYNVTNYKSIWAEAGRVYVIFSSYIYNKGYDCSSSFSLTMDYIVDMRWAILDHEG